MISERLQHRLFEALEGCSESYGEVATQIVGSKVLEVMDDALAESQEKILELKEKVGDLEYQLWVALGRPQQDQPEEPSE